MPASKEAQPPSRPLAAATLEQYAGIIHDMIQHEDEIMDQRITWLCQIQGLLFAALAFAWKEPTANSLIPVLCIFGTAVAITTWIALRRVWQGVEKLLEWWSSNSAVYSGPTIYARKGSGDLVG